MKTLAFLLLTLLLSSSCNNLGVVDLKNSPTTTTPTPTPDKNNTSVIQPHILKLWSETVPEDLKALTNQQNFKIDLQENDDAIVTWERVNSDLTTSFYRSEYRNGTWTHPQINSAFHTSTNAIAYGLLTKFISESEAMVFIRDGEHILLQHLKNKVWLPIVQVDTFTKPIYLPMVAVSPNGKVMIGAIQDGETLSTLTFNGSIWTHQNDVRFQDNSPFPLYFIGIAELAINDNGQAVMLFNTNDQDALNALYKAEFYAGSWSMPASNVDSLGYANGNNYSVSLNNSKAVIAWQPSGTQELRILENNNGAWSSVVTYPLSNISSINHLISRMDANGNYFIVVGDTSAHQVHAKTSGALGLIGSFPLSTGYSDMKVATIMDNKIRFAWHDYKSISFGQCSFTSCTPGVLASAVETDEQGYETTKSFTSISFNSKRGIAFYWTQAYQPDWTLINEIGGVELPQGESTYEMPRFFSAFASIL